MIYKPDTNNIEKLNKLICELTQIKDVSSQEENIATALKDKLSSICDSVKIDRAGNVVGFINANCHNAKTIMLEAHMDRIGLMVSKIHEDGALSFVSIGGIDERILPYSEIEIIGRKIIEGIIFVKDENKSTNPKIEDMRIDTGYSETEINKIVKIGDMALVKSNYNKLYGMQVSSSAMDNRAGVAAILNAISNIDRNNLKYNITVLFSVQEELGLHGAYIGAESYKSNAVIVIDVTHGTTPDSKEEVGVFPLGCGAVICRGPNFDYKYTLNLIEVAKSKQIPFKIEVASGPSGTDAWATQISGEGIPSMLVSMPLKYMHTNVETLDLIDVDAVSALVLAAIEGGALLD